MRPFRSDDLDALLTLHEDDAYWWYPLRRRMTPEETARFLERMLVAHDRSDEPSLHAVVVRETGELAGYTGLSVPRFLPEILPAVEVGWRLGARCRGHGYATEAARAAMTWGFTDLALTELVSIFEPDNVASGRVMDRLGFDDGFLTADPESGRPLRVRRLTRESWDTVAAT